MGGHSLPTISIASHLTAGANGEDAWLFTVSRDRRLKAWSLTTGLCLKELPLDLNNNTRSTKIRIHHQNLTHSYCRATYFALTGENQFRDLTMGLWAVWDDEIGGEGILQYTILHETKNWQDTSNRGWTTIQPPDRKTPWNSSYFDELLANDPSSSVTEIFIDHLFRPGHFSFSDLEYGLATYENSLEEIDEQQLDNSIYETLEEKICSIVGSNVNLEISNLTGVPMIEGYHRKLRIEWLKFATMCTESRASSLWPIELAVDADRQQVFINGRSGTIEVLISSLSHVDVIKPLEDELSQTARRPFKSSIIDVTEDLFNRRLEPFLVDDDSLIHVSDRINQIKDLELSLQTLWKSYRALN
ncbi:hypothetical protein H4Q26_012873 [Puccinia striiformis f. sp. tritici PST-130]|nr:hypothetical protein H4Q26_012873 [Puccinia striiformis f. sp. tritici PST-130]